MGTLDWLGLPDDDGHPVFGALLDAGSGGSVRTVASRECSVTSESFALQTKGRLPEGELELLDVMAWPQTERDSAFIDARTVLRRLRARGGRVRWRFDFAPWRNFEKSLY